MPGISQLGAEYLTSLLFYVDVQKWMAPRARHTWESDRVQSRLRKEWACYRSANCWLDDQISLQVVRNSTDRGQLR